LLQIKFIIEKMNKILSFFPRVSSSNIQLKSSMLKRHWPEEKHKLQSSPFQQPPYANAAAIRQKSFSSSEEKNRKS